MCEFIMIVIINIMYINKSNIALLFIILKIAFLNILKMRILNFCIIIIIKMTIILFKKYLLKIFLVI